MVQTTVEKLSPTRVKLNISVTPEELKPSITHAYEHIAEQVTIPGFRKGKVPPPIIDQRVGRAEVLNHAVSESLDRFYRAAAQENEVRAVGRPEADIAKWPDEKTFEGDLEIVVEVDVRPEFDLPAYEGLKLEVTTAEVSDEEVATELENLRGRFGTLVTVDRPAKTGDFLQIDLTAEIAGNTVDTASNISYELGSGELIDGIDEALETLTAGESTNFSSKLLGGDHEGEDAQIAVTVNAVKERELPEADDDFAQIASQFDTLDELKADLRTQLGTSKVFGQGAEARDKIVDTLLEQVEIPVPAKLVEDEVHRHLEQENRLEDDEHRAEVTESSEKTFRSQVLLDAIAEKEEIKVSQNELTTYLVQGAAQYGMEPGQFIQALDQNGQIPAMVAEVARSKVLATILSKAEIVDGEGAAVDVEAFTSGILGDGSDDSETIDITDRPSADDDEHAGHNH
ncbi:trigger factor [Homoserinibacter sp. YIM 151385]|uniref:trigger factor n=1 Tax=Homoserinibacter sp. YIM 151385 TaxID=2985506 RepID=UPI0022EFE0B9|nr:trigger factor [Homoserinibacter sp. YIM 151385]WBU39024.1 trigger factor [Homoserinibacter sp. YIM 151385]